MTLDRHRHSRAGLENHPVIIRARDFYLRMGYLSAIYVTYSLQYWCNNMTDRAYWAAVRAEIKIIYSYRPDNT